MEAGPGEILKPATLTAPVVGVVTRAVVGNRLSTACPSDMLVRLVVVDLIMVEVVEERERPVILMGWDMVEMASPTTSQDRPFTTVVVAVEVTLEGLEAMVEAAPLMEGPVQMVEVAEVQADIPLPVGLVVVALLSFDMRYYDGTGDR